MRIVIGVIVGCTLAACASSRARGQGGDDDAGSGEPPPATATLAISPAASELVIGIGQIAQSTYTATLTYRDGTVKDVTAQTAFRIDDSYGKFTANVVAIGTAVRTKVYAVYVDPSVNAAASGDVVVRVKSVRTVAPLADTAAGLFTSDGVPSFAPQIKYPPPDTVMPRNLGDFEIHWADTNGNNVFEISLSDKNPGDPHDDSLTDVRVYVPGDNQAPGASYAAFTPAEWDAARGYKNAVTYQVRGVNTAKPGVVGAAAPQTVQLSNEKMDGGLYYWATASDSNVIGIYRHDMNKPGERAQEYITTNQTAGRCVGCHVLSRDGTRMAITYEDTPTPPGPATMVDVAAVGIQPQTQRWNFGTFTPDGTQFLSVDHGVLVARDATTQAILATMTTTASSKWVTQPDVTSGGDGKPLKLVYVIPALFGTDYSFKLGQIYTRTYDQATHTFGNDEQLLLADGLNNFFPSWSPDGNWIAFNKCDTSNNGTSYDNRTSATWVMKADGTQQRPLALANQAADVTNSAVRWAPFQLSFGPAKEPMFWLTMSSKRDFGVRMTNTGLAQTLKRAQIWMTPFFPARATAQQDPSTPAFRLPFQNLDSSNQTAQWAERIVPVIL